MTAALEDENAELRRANAELRQRLEEGLAREAATAEVLQVINSSPGDLTPVFETLLERAHRLCGIAFGALQLEEAGKFRSVAARGLGGGLADLLREPFEPVPGSPPRRLIDGERIVHVADLAGERAAAGRTE